MILKQNGEDEVIVPTFLFVPCVLNPDKSHSIMFSFFCQLFGAMWSNCLLHPDRKHEQQTEKNKYILLCLYTVILCVCVCVGV